MPTLRFLLSFLILLFLGVNVKAIAQPDLKKPKDQCLDAVHLKSIPIIPSMIPICSPPEFALPVYEFARHSSPVIGSVPNDTPMYMNTEYLSQDNDGNLWRLVVFCQDKTQRHLLTMGWVMVATEPERPSDAPLPYAPPEATLALLH